MKYWGLLAGKLGVCGALSYGLLAAINALWPAAPRVFNVVIPRFGYDLAYTLVIGLWFLLSCGLLSICVHDQRYRCRVCLRRLRMPVENGSWGRMLQFGRPHIEYICPYGHGSLNVAALQISGLENPEWTPGTDMWEELCATSEKDGRN